MVGRVVSTKMNKTAVVIVESKKTHHLYRKSFAWSKKYLVDDPFNVKDGDIVIFEKVRPVSKLKHWQIKKVLGQDIVSIEEAELLAGSEEAIAEVLPEQKGEVKEPNQEVVEKPKEQPKKKANKKKEAKPAAKS